MKYGSQLFRYLNGRHRLFEQLQACADCPHSLLCLAGKDLHHADASSIGYCANCFTVTWFNRAEGEIHHCTQLPQGVFARSPKTHSPESYVHMAINKDGREIRYSCYALCQEFVRRKYLHLIESNPRDARKRTQYRYAADQELKTVTCASILRAHGEPMDS